VYDVALDNHDRPVIVYETVRSPQHHLYWYARWTGAGWIHKFLVDGGPSISPGTMESGYAGGLTVDHSNPSVVFLSRKLGSHFQIERWTTADHGSTWNHTIVTRAAGIDNLRPVVPPGPGEGLLWLRGRYVSYTGYQTQMAFEPPPRG
jgi:hypothetical protein